MYVPGGGPDYVGKVGRIISVLTRRACMYSIHRYLTYVSQDPEGGKEAVTAQINPTLCITHNL